MSIPLDVQCEILRGGARKGQESPAQDSKTQYANPDVSGIGVLIGFLTTAWATWLLVTFYFLMRCVEEKFLNKVDRMFLTKASFLRPGESVPRLELALRRIVLMFSDQQVVTGIALLASGYAQLSSGISNYHWQMLVYLAWFSSLTHLSTLTVLRQYFQDNRKARLWRAVLMLITVLMLGAALLPTSDTLWLNASEPLLWLDPNHRNHLVPILAPALCYFRRLGSRDSHDRFKIRSWTGTSMIISLVVLISGYITRMLKLWDHASNNCRYYLREVPSKTVIATRGAVLKRLNRPAPSFYKIHWVVAYAAVETPYIWLKALFDIYESMIAEIIWLASALAWGTRNLLMARSDAAMSEENTWGFGQMFPVILLVLPILSALETYYEKDLSENLPGVPGEALESGTANNGISPPSNPGNPPLAFYVGHWQSKPQAAASSVVLDDGRTIRSTETGLQMEEQPPGELESRRSLSSPQPGPTTTNVNPESQLGLTEPIGLATTLDYYQLHWFWIVVSVILFQAVFLVAMILLVFRHPIQGWTLVYGNFAYHFVPFTILTWGFLMLSRFHATLGQISEKILKIPREQHGRWLIAIGWSFFAMSILLNVVRPWAVPSRLR